MIDKIELSLKTFQAEIEKARKEGYEKARIEVYAKAAQETWEEAYSAGFDNGKDFGRQQAVDEFHNKQAYPPNVPQPEVKHPVTATYDFEDCDYQSY